MTNKGNQPVITRECEDIIDQLVDHHGYEKVKRNLDSLIGLAKWNDWQSICDYLDRIGGRAKTQKKSISRPSAKRPLQRKRSTR